MPRLPDETVDRIIKCYFELGRSHQEYEWVQELAWIWIMRVANAVQFALESLPFLTVSKSVTRAFIPHL